MPKKPGHQALWRAGLRAAILLGALAGCGAEDATDPAATPAGGASSLAGQGGSSAAGHAPGAGAAGAASGAGTGGVSAGGQSGSGTGGVSAGGQSGSGTGGVSAGGQGGASGAGTGGAAGGGQGGAACSACARDWALYPPVTQVDGVGEIWALSDVHGDYGALVALLAGAKIIGAAPASPVEATWGAGSACLVVVGDLIDKGPDAPDVVRLLAALTAAAPAAGGRVVVTMGNHEAEFLADPANSKASGPDGLDPQLQSLGLDPATTAAGGDDIGLFLRRLPFAARVGGWFFAHGGNTHGQPLAALSQALEQGVDAAGFGAVVLSDPDSLLEARLSKDGPQWWDATGDPKALLTTWSAALGASHLVMGHQPGAVGFADGSQRAKDEMAEKYGGRLFLIDTGLSAGADGTGGALLHVTDAGGAGEAWERVLPDGSTHKVASP